MSTGHRVTLADVSRAAGVGLATVSRALAPHDHPDVKPETRDRIRRIARELGYRPSATARALRSGDARAISLIVSDQGWGWNERLFRSAFLAATHVGYQLFVHPVAGLGSGSAAVIAGLASLPTQGVITTATTESERAAVEEAAERLNLPVVAIDDYSTSVTLPTVAADNRGGARLAVEHLLAQGRRRIAILHAWDGSYFADERVGGYRDALDDAGLPPAPDLAFSCGAPIDESVLTWPQLDRALADGVAFDALFCVADMLAPAAYRSLRRYDRRIPEDVAVVGFDDERVAGVLDPPLSSVRQPYDEIAALAVRELLAAIGGGDVRAGRVELPAAFVTRASS